MSPSPIINNLEPTINFMNSFANDLSNVINNTDFDSMDRQSSNGAGTALDASLNKLYDDIETLRPELTDAQTDLNNKYNNYNTAMSQINSGSNMINQLSQKTTQNIKEQNNMISNEISNKRRMMEINNYYSNMNTYINSIIRNLIIIVSIIIFFTILSKRGIIPANITSMLTLISIIGIIIYVAYSIYDINIRDKFNFNEYVIPFDITAKHLADNSQSDNNTNIRTILGRELIKGVQEMEQLTGTCFGEDCCQPGTIYDIDRKSCIIQCPSGQIYTTFIDTQNNNKLTGQCK